MRNYLLIFIFLLAAAAPSFALTVPTIPGNGTIMQIANVQCGQSYVGAASQILITNSGRGGMLCWYYTGDSGRQKLTGECIDPGNTQAYPATLNMPVSGAKRTDVQLECYDFYDGENDTCQDSSSFSYAQSNRYSCANGDGSGCFGYIIPVIKYNLSCDAVSFDLVLKNDSIALFNGQSALLQYNVTNTMKQILNCDNGIGLLFPNQTVFKGVNVSAPATGTGTFSFPVTVMCIWSGGTSLTKLAEIAVSYQPDACINELGAAEEAAANATGQYRLAARNLSMNSSSAFSQAAADVADMNSALAAARSACSAGNRGAARQSIQLTQQKAVQAGQDLAAAGQAQQTQQAQNSSQEQPEQIINWTGSNQSGNSPLPGLSQEMFLTVGIIVLILAIVLVIVLAL